MSDLSPDYFNRPLAEVGVDVDVGVLDRGGHEGQGVVDDVGEVLQLVDDELALAGKGLVERPVQDLSARDRRLGRDLRGELPPLVDPRDRFPETVGIRRHLVERDPAEVLLQLLFQTLGVVAGSTSPGDTGSEEIDQLVGGLVGSLPWCS